MEFIFFTGGLLVGIVLSMIFKKRYKTYGFVEIDRMNNLCKVHISNDGLMDERTTKALFDMRHHADLSREEQSL